MGETKGAAECEQDASREKGMTAAGVASGFEALPSPEDLVAERRRRELAEHNALALVFDDVRAQSADSALVSPTRWAEIGLVPGHMDAEEFEMFVYEYLEQELAAREETAAKEPPKPARTYRPATRMVGVPPKIGKAAEEAGSSVRDASVGFGGDSENVVPVAAADVAAAAAPCAAPSSDEAQRSAGSSEVDVGTGSSADVDNPFSGLSLPAGYQLVELEGEWVLVPSDEEPEPVELPIDCENVVALVGAHSYYLYDRTVMTDAFARWSLLAAEDDDLVTFVECVREDSRVYPRPMPLQSLMNDPFKMTREKIEGLWEQVSASGAYPDIERITASNGDVYYFSTKSLSRTYAESLAEWDAVERYMNV